MRICCVACLQTRWLLQAPPAYVRHKGGSSACAPLADTYGWAAVRAQAAQPSRSLLHAKGAYGHKHHGPAKHGHGYGHKHHGPAKHSHGYGHKHHGPAKHGHGAYGVHNHLSRPLT